MGSDAIRGCDFNSLTPSCLDEHEITLLPPAMFNPTGFDRLRQEYTELGQIFKVAGFPGVESPSRYFLEVHSDAGAMFRPNDRASYLYGIITYLGGFHVMSNTMDAVCKALDHQGMEDVASKHGYSSPGQLGYVMGNCKYDKTKTFLSCVVRVAMGQSLINTIIKASNGKLSRESIQLEDCNAYLQNDEGDLNFRNVKNIFNVLNSLELMFASESTDDVSNGQAGMDRYDAGRRFLLPFFYSCGSVTYGPETVLEMLMVYVQFKREFREYHRSSWIIDNKHHDRRMEEVNRGQKFHCGGGMMTKKVVEESTVLLANSRESEKSSLASVDLRKKAHGYSRSFMTLAPDLAAVTKLLDDEEIWVKTPDRKETYHLGNRGKTVDAKLTMEALMKYGEEGLQRNLPALVSSAVGDNKRPKHPQAAWNVLVR